MKRSGQLLRVVATLVVMLLASSMSRWPTAVTRTCAGACPVDCPMHAKKLHCHEASGATCHKTRPAGVSLHAPACAHAASAVGGKDDVAVLESNDPLELVTAVGILARRVQPVPDVVLDPPFHPPRAQASPITAA